jgi:hypothetical protein
MGVSGSIATDIDGIEPSKSLDWLIVEFALAPWQLIAEVVSVPAVPGRSRGSSGKAA